MAMVSTRADIPPSDTIPSIETAAIGFRAGHGTCSPDGKRRGSLYRPPLLFRHIEQPNGGVGRWRRPSVDSPVSGWLFRAMFDAAHHRARKSGLNEEDASDCALAFIAQRFENLRCHLLAVSRHRTPFPDNPTGYLHACARNAVNDYRYQRDRSSQRECPFSQWSVSAGRPDQEEVLDWLPTDRPPIDKLAEFGVFRTITERQINTLSPSLRECGRLYFLEEMPIEEVARRSGRSVTAAERAVRRCREILRERLNTLGWNY